MLTPRLVAAALALAAAVPAAARPATGDWPRFGVDAARTSDLRAGAGVSAADLPHLRRQRVRLPGTVDSSPILVRGVRMGGRGRDLLVMTTTYGTTLALYARSGRAAWTFRPPGQRSLLGTPQITTATPVADPASGTVYAASPDGRVHALSLATGRERRGWPVAVTRDATHEKIASALTLSRGRLVVVTGGYVGDAPPYQGHVVTIDARTGHVHSVWNALCSNRRGLMVPSSCSASDAAIWGRAAASVQPGTGRLLVATGNAPYDGRTDWGDSVLELSPDGSRLLGAYTPRNQRELNDRDLDLGSSAPVPLPGDLALQGGKDALLRLIDLRRLSGGAAGPARLGGELQTLPTPGRAQLFTAPAVDLHARGGPRIFVADGSGTAAYVLSGRRLHELWSTTTPGTSPVLAGGLLWVYDPSGNGLNVMRPGSPRPLATLRAGKGHWNSPIVADGVVALPEGDANDHATTGVLDIWRVPSPTGATRRRPA